MVTELIHKIFNNIWPMLVVFIIAIAFIRFFYLQNHKERFCLHKELGYLISILYIWLLFEILTNAEVNSYSGVNLIPFQEIFRYKVGSYMFNYNVIGNILIFIPFGYLIGSYVNPKSIWPVLITALGTSFSVEFVQHQIGRAFDIDDIILNVLGTIIGYFLYIGFSAIKKHLPRALTSDTFYNIVAIILIILFLIYILGYWHVWGNILK